MQLHSEEKEQIFAQRAEKKDMDTFLVEVMADAIRKFKKKEQESYRSLS